MVAQAHWDLEQRPVAILINSPTAACSCLPRLTAASHATLMLSTYAQRLSQARSSRSNSQGASRAHWSRLSGRQDGTADTSSATCCARLYAYTPVPAQRPTRPTPSTAAFSSTGGGGLTLARRTSHRWAASAARPFSRPGGPGARGEGGGGGGEAGGAGNGGPPGELGAAAAQVGVLV